MALTEQPDGSKTNEAGKVVVPAPDTKPQSEETKAEATDSDSAPKESHKSKK